MNRLTELVARAKRSRVWRSWTRYTDSRGDLLAGGVAYYAFFSIFPAIALAFTIFGIVLHDRPELLEEIRQSVDAALPGFVRDGDKGIIPIEAPSAAALSWTGAVGVLGLLWAGLGWLGALRTGIRVIFDAPGNPGNFVTAKLRDLGVLLVLGVAIVVSAAVTGVAGTAAQWVADQLGLGGQGWILKLVSIVVGVLLDGGIILVMLRMLSGVGVPWRGLWRGAVVGGLGMTVLKVVGTSLLGAMNNPLFASIALVVGLLVWLNLMSRVVLLSAAWAANDLDDSADGPAPGNRGGATEGAVEANAARPELVRSGPSMARDGSSAPGGRQAPDGVGELTRAERIDAGVPTFGAGAADRTTLAAGAVLGAAFATGTGLAWRALRRLVGR